MTPENQQTVYTVLDCLALLLTGTVAGFALVGIFVGNAHANATRFWCLVWVLSCAWLALRGFRVIV